MAVMRYCDKEHGMELYGEKSRSIPQKMLIHIVEIIFLLLSYWILFGRGADFLQSTFGIRDAGDDWGRRTIIFVFNIVIFLRLAFTMFYLLQRKIPWEESISIPFAFALYYVGYSVFVLPVNTSIDWLDAVAILIFIIECTLNTGGELLRYVWKRDPANKGKIYTGGFFTYAMHINYFGDLMWVTGYALVTRNWYSAVIPAFLFSFFVWYNIPKLDRYLHEKYGKDFEQYAGRTKKLVPFIY